MIITNKLNLPASFVNFVSKDSKGYKEHRYSVTELLLPTREILLNRKYERDIEIDVSDTIPVLFGTAVHSILENNTPLLNGLLTETSIEAEFDTNIVSGRIDLLNDKDDSIEDYKTCSVNKIIKQDFEDNRKQGLMYALLLFKRTGHVYRNLKFWNLLKDWSKIKAASSSNYPQSPIYLWTYKVEDSDIDFIEKYIKDKLKEIDNAIESDLLPECTNEERWYTGTKYAIYKNAGDKKASKVLDSEEEAHDYITNECNGSGEIEVRKGEYIKCKFYCNCSKFCKEGGQ